MRDEVSKKVRRILLKPLGGRTNSLHNRKSYLSALHRLDERALGEAGLDQLKEILGASPQHTDPRRWKDVSYVIKQVAFAKALYQSRRISRQEYVFFATSPVEQFHEERIFNSQYVELTPIIERIDKIEKNHGLKDGEYWPRGCGPKEHVRLNREYDDVVERKFLETLREFQLEDLAALYRADRAEFDKLRERGRRSVFHKEEYSHALKDIVRRYEAEAATAAHVGAYSAAITSLGASLEGLLILRCLRSKRKAVEVAKSLPKRFRPKKAEEIETWTFEALIEVCLAAGWLPAVETEVADYNTAGLAHLIRSIRNYVHPGKRAHHQAWIVTEVREYDDAKAIYAVVASVLNKKRKRE